MSTPDMSVPLAGPMAPRLRKPSWRDPRLLIGLVLLFTSVTLGARVIALADQTEPVYSARATLPTGTPLTLEVLDVVRLRLTGTEAAYLQATNPLPPGQVLIRTVGAGEIVPLTAVGPADRILTRPVSIPMEGQPPAGLAPGGLVDLWASAKRRDAGGGGYAEPEPIARSVETAGIHLPGNGLSVGRTGSVEVLLPPEALTSVLDALANQARVVVLPVPGAATQARS